MGGLVGGCKLNLEFLIANYCKYNFRGDGYVVIVQMNYFNSKNPCSLVKGKFHCFCSRLLSTVETVERVLSYA